MIRASGLALVLVIAAAPLLACGTSAADPGEPAAASAHLSTTAFEDDTALLTDGTHAIIAAAAAPTYPVEMDALVSGTLTAGPSGCLLSEHDGTQERTAIKFPYGAVPTEHGVELPDGGFMALDKPFSVGGGSLQLAEVLPQQLIEECELTGVHEIFVLNARQ